MRNLKIGKKLLVVFGTIIILFCITVIVAIASLQSTGKSFRNFYSNGYEMEKKTLDMQRAIQSAAKNIGYSMMVSDAEGTQKYIDACQSDLAALKDGITYLKENFTGDQALVNNFESIMDSGVDAKERIYQYSLNLDNANASSVFFKEYQPLLLQGIQALNAISEAASMSAGSIYDSSISTLNITTIMLLALSAVALLVTIFLAAYIIKSLTRPIKELEHVADQIAGGDLNAVILYESKDELGQLSDSMRKMTSLLKGIIGDVEHRLESLGDGDFTGDSKVPELYVGNFKELLTSMRHIVERLTNTLSQIGQSSDQVSSGADQVSSGAQALSQGATEQASSVQELAATIAEISSQIKTNALNAQQANKLVEETGNEVMKSNDQMQNMIAAMDEINGSSSEIGKIIKTIEDIAFQTNILALNAAVEAARAGAAGKGFAVVADEVRSLASKSAEASKNTAALIENSLRAVENGTTIANETATSLAKVVEGATEITKNIDLITKASSEQAQSIAQVAQGVDQISSVVQTNSATAEESAAASEELSGQAQILRNLVSQFKLRQ